MSETLPACTEMELAPDLREEAYRRAYQENARNRSFPGRPHTRYWRRDAQLRVRFLDGDPSLHWRIEEAAMVWRSCANVGFQFGDDPDAEIRVTFGEPVLWSYVGTDALLVPADQPTMCLGVLTPLSDDRTIRACTLHAFGHVLGLTHEHQLAIGWGDDLSDGVANFVARIYPYYRSARPREPEMAAPEEPATGSESTQEAILPGPPAPVAEPELSEERIRLDVATPAQVRVEEPFELAVAVRQPNAPVLAVDDLPQVLSEEGSVFRPADEDIIKYRIEVTGADCTVEPSHYVILLRKGTNSPPRYFQVTPHKAGRQAIIVSAYQEDEALAAQTRVRIEVQLPVQTPAHLRGGGPVSPSHEDAILQPDDPLKGLKGQLVDALSRLSVTDSSLGRTSLLDGIPGADTLNRDENNRRLDLDLIVTQLAQRGRLASGQMAIAKLIDNALPYASGFEIEGRLRAIQQQLE